MFTNTKKALAQLVQKALKSGPAEYLKAQSLAITGEPTVLKALCQQQQSDLAAHAARAARTASGEIDITRADYLIAHDLLVSSNVLDYDVFDGLKHPPVFDLEPVNRDTVHFCVQAVGLVSDLANAPGVDVALLQPLTPLEVLRASSGVLELPDELISNVNDLTQDRVLDIYMGCALSIVVYAADVIRMGKLDGGGTPLSLAGLRSLWGTSAAVCSALADALPGVSSPTRTELFIACINEPSAELASVILDDGNPESLKTIKILAVTKVLVNEAAAQCASVPETSCIRKLGIALADYYVLGSHKDLVVARQQWRQIWYGGDWLDAAPTGEDFGGDVTGDATTSEPIDATTGDATTSEPIDATTGDAAPAVNWDTVSRLASKGLRIEHLINATPSRVSYLGKAVALFADELSEHTIPARPLTDVALAADALVSAAERVIEASEAGVVGPAAMKALTNSVEDRVHGLLALDAVPQVRAAIVSGIKWSLNYPLRDDGDAAAVSIAEAAAGYWDSPQPPSDLVKLGDLASVIIAAASGAPATTADTESLDLLIRLARVLKSEADAAETGAGTLLDVDTAIESLTASRVFWLVDAKLAEELRTLWPVGSTPPTPAAVNRDALLKTKDLLTLISLVVSDAPTAARAAHAASIANAALDATPGSTAADDLVAELDDNVSALVAGTVYAVSDQDVETLMAIHPLSPKSLGFKLKSLIDWPVFPASPRQTLDIEWSVPDAATHDLDAYISDTGDTVVKVPLEVGVSAGSVDVSEPPTLTIVDGVGVSESFIALDRHHNNRDDIAALAKTVRDRLDEVGLEYRDATLEAVTKVDLSVTVLSDNPESKVGNINLDAAVRDLCSDEGFKQLAV